MDTLLMDDDYVLRFLDRVRAFKPEILFGHGHSLYYFAKFIADHGIKDIEFKGIISSAEALPPEERKVVEEVFGNIVFDRYGCEEVSLIASECETHEGMHTEPGRLVITDLSNYAMPLIRYEIGDLSTTMSGECACGRGLPRLGRVVGRTTDILYTPEGRKISGVSILDTFTIHIPGFKQIQIVQEKINEVIFHIVKDEHFSEKSLQLLGEQVPRIFGPKMTYQIKFVDKVALTSRGKFQFTICKLDQEDIPD
jgi:phenylacetate-CoA ligase